MREAKPRKIKAKCGAPKGGGGGEKRSVFPWKFGGIPANFVSIGLGQRVPINCKKIVINILEGQTLRR